MCAALVAAALAGVALTTVYATAGAIATVVVAAVVDDMAGGRLAAHVAFAVAVGVLAVWLASLVDARRTALPAGRPDDLDADDVTSALMHARTVGDVASAAVQHAMLFGASVARIAVSDERDMFSYVADTLPRAVHEEHTLFSLHGEDPAAAAIRDRRPSYWSSFGAFARRHARAAAVLRAASPRSVAILPLVGERQALGVWVLGFVDPHPFDVRERARLERVATEITVALERSLLFEFERSVATELQRSLLGPPVLLERAGHCTRYIPAVSTLSVGGDWYGTIPLADGRIGVAVGDAVGRGLGAATVMGQLRSALGACSLRSESPADAIDTLEEFAAGITGASGTTVAYAIVDPDAKQVEYCCAGHPPPLCVTLDGDATLLEGGRTWPLGVGVEKRRTNATHDFPEGALLMLYSDGLVERRRQSLDVGLDRLLREAKARVLLPIDELADQLLDAMLADSDRTDDVVLLILRSQALTPNLLLRKLRADPDELRNLRREVRAWLELAGVDEPIANDLLIAVGEACMNVVQHAYANEAHRLVRVEGAVIDGDVVLTVTDTGTWKEHSTRSVGGRGVKLMRDLVPSVQFSRRATGTTVTFRCPSTRDGSATSVLV
jgi:serine phosphatase RsbU (regulator of sigma subunit)/anti-sigma regulatory factor (Ser/Thr protein kinase)